MFNSDVAIKVLLTLVRKLGTISLFRGDLRNDAN
jgi:hypothetical protein